MSTSSEMAGPAESVCRISCEVLHGDKVGRILGFPTASMIFSGRDKPTYGIYAANFDIRPTFTPPKELLEAHILDFSEDLFDQQLEIELVHFLRPEKKFEDMASLCDQLRQNYILARVALAERSADFRSAKS